jgi:hypothetical protein
MACPRRHACNQTLARRSTHARTKKSIRSQIHTFCFITTRRIFNLYCVVRARCWSQRVVVKGRLGTRISLAYDVSLRGMTECLQKLWIFKFTKRFSSTVKTHIATSECPWYPKPAFYYYFDVSNVNLSAWQAAEVTVYQSIVQSNYLHSLGREKETQAHA